VLSTRRNDAFLSFTGMKEVHFNTYHQYAEYYKNSAVHMLWEFCLWRGSHVTLYLHPSLYQWHFFFIETLCWAISRWTSGIAKCARMHRLELSKQYTTFPKCPDQLGGPHSLPRWISGFFPRVKWLECEADHWTPFSAELGMSRDIPLLSYTPSWCEQQTLLWCLNSYVPNPKHTVRLIFKSLSWV
jgi:hypothetical protein